MLRLRERREKSTIEDIPLRGVAGENLRIEAVMTGHEFGRVITTRVISVASHSVRWENMNGTPERSDKSLS